MYPYIELTEFTQDGQDYKKVALRNQTTDRPKAPGIIFSINVPTLNLPGFPFKQHLYIEAFSFLTDSSVPLNTIGWPAVSQIAYLKLCSIERE
jgi:hypothetical protein